MKPGQKAPRRKASGLLSRVWWVIRRRGDFILPDLLATVATESDGAVESHLSRYLRALTQAGILQVDKRRQPGTAHVRYHRYHLARDLGRGAPVYRIRSKEVFDPNSGEVIKLNKEKSHG